MKKRVGKATFGLDAPSATYDVVEELEKDMNTDDLYANPKKFNHLVKLLGKDIESIKTSKDAVN